MTKKIPMRMCVGCRQMHQKSDMVRVVKTPEGKIEIDTTGKKNGRGAYLCKKKSCFQKALSGHGLERSLKTGISREIFEILMKEMEDTFADEPDISCS